jgi:predicted secreted protein
MRNFAIRIVLSWCALLACSAMPAGAGDAAALRVLGFSTDGRYFAFEQYWTVYEETASAAEIQVIDTVSDTWLPGTPFRADLTGDSENVSYEVAIARARALALAKPTLDRLAIGSRGTVFRPNDVPLDQEGYYNMVPKEFAPSLQVSLGDGSKAILTLEARPLGRRICGASKIETEVAGFVLTLTKTGAAPRILHADASLPRKRRCASSYGLALAVLQGSPASRPTLAVIVQLDDNQDAFEGPDRRFMAVTATLQ